MTKFALKFPDLDANADVVRKYRPFDTLDQLSVFDAQSGKFQREISRMRIVLQPEFQCFNLCRSGRTLVDKLLHLNFVVLDTLQSFKEIHFD